MMKKFLAVDLESYSQSLSPCPCSGMKNMEFGVYENFLGLRAAAITQTSAFVSVSVMGSQRSEGSIIVT